MRLVTLGLVIAAFIVGGSWFWVGLGTAALMVFGVVGGTKRAAAGWFGALALLMGALVHVKLMEPLIGSALAGIATMGFLLVWTQGPVRREAPVVPPAPYLIHKRVG